MDRDMKKILEVLQEQQKTLSKLEKKGFITCLPITPKQYKINDIKKIKSLINNKQNEIKKLDSLILSATAPEIIDIAVATKTTWKKKSAASE